MPLARALAAERRGDEPRRTRCASPLAWLRPIDSEHSAIWQCLVGERMAGVDALDPDRVGRAVPRRARRTSPTVTPEQALRHPTWSMGAKITIDSATLANKGLEVVEAHWLYDVDYDAIEVVIHPQSVVHSAVRFVDGSLKAQLGTPDMRLPIQYALTYPDRRPSPSAAVDLVGRRPARLPGPRRDALPGAADRPRGGPDRAARDDRAHRRRRGRRRPVPRRHARLRRDPAPARGRGRAVRRGRRPGAGRRRADRARRRGPRGVRRGTGGSGLMEELFRTAVTIVLFLADPRRARAHPRARPLPDRPARRRPGPRVRDRLPAPGEGPPVEGRDALHPELAADRRLRQARGRGRRRRPTTRARSSAQPLPIKLVILVAGVVMNLALAFVIFTAHRLARDAARSASGSPRSSRTRRRRRPGSSRATRSSRSTATSTSSSATGTSSTTSGTNVGKTGHARRSSAPNGDARDVTVTLRSRAEIDASPRDAPAGDEGPARHQRRRGRLRAGVLRRLQPRPAGRDRGRRAADGPLVRADPRRPRRPRRRLRRATRRRRRRSPARSASRPRSATSSWQRGRPDALRRGDPVGQPRPREHPAVPAARRRPDADDRPEVALRRPDQPPRRAADLPRRVRVPVRVPDLGHRLRHRPDSSSGSPTSARPCPAPTPSARGAGRPSASTSAASSSAPPIRSSSSR